MDLVEAIQAYGKGCTAQAVRSCVMLARMKQKGIGTEVQRDVASSLLERAYEIGSSEDCRKLAQVIVDGNWLERDGAMEKKFSAKGCQDDDCGRRTVVIAPGAVEELKKACGSGDNEACLRGGKLLLKHGRGSVDEQVADMFEAACKGGLGEACLARVRQSEHRRQDLESAHRSELLTRGCELNSGEACSEIGFGYARQYASKENVAHAISFLRRGCILGDSAACTQLADYLKRQGPAKIPLMPLYERACEFDTRGGGCNVARVEDGFQDGERYLWTCKKVSRDACVKAGLLYARGRGVKQIGGYFTLDTSGVKENPMLALEAFQAGCDKGDVHSCSQMAMLYYQGKGVRKDESRAVKLWTAGCDGGDGMSCYVLSELNTQGAAGFAQDRAAGIALNEKGCGFGWGASCLEIAWAYWYGDSVPQDTSKSMDILEKSCAAGDTPCCNLLSRRKDDLAHLAKAEGECPRSGHSCVFSADGYAAGVTTQRDTRKAAALYEKACTSPAAESSFDREDAKRGCLGAALYASSKSTTERERLFQRACAKESGEEARHDRDKSHLGCTATACLQGDARSCIQFGSALWFGQAEPHRQIAFDWIAKGCGRAPEECSSAINKLRQAALFLAKGDDGNSPFGRKLLVDIRKFLGSRCQQGEDGRSCFALGDMVKNGHGGAPNEGESQRLTKKACELGCSDACIAIRGAQ
jgi:hypothetical protein